MKDFGNLYYLLAALIILIGLFTGGRRMAKDATIKSLQELCDAQGRQIALLKAENQELRDQNEDQEKRIQHLEELLGAKLVYEGSVARNSGGRRKNSPANPAN